MSGESKPTTTTSVGRAHKIAGNGAYAIEMEPGAPAQMKIRISGTLNEDVNFGVIFESLSIIPEASRQNLAFDLERVTSINSCGVREWLLFLEQLASQKAVFRFQAIGETFVDQASTIPNLLGPPGTPVDSLIAPFFCEGCSTRTIVRMSGEQFLARAENAPGIPCPKCKKPTIFDGIEQEYQIFLQRSRSKAV
jgi:hypothetical protein